MTKENDDQLIRVPRKLFWDLVARVEKLELKTNVLAVPATSEKPSCETCMGSPHDGDCHHCMSMSNYQPMSRK